MSQSKATEKKLEEVIRVLSRLKGVSHAFYLTKEMRTGLGETERNYPSLGPLTVRNEGVLESLKRKHVACILKDKRFRAPPHATVYLLDDDHRVLGRELLPGEKIHSTKGRKAVKLGNDFVIFFQKGTGKGAHFVLPSVPFKEIERLDGVKSVCSASPSTRGDLFLRKKAHLKDDPKLASILVGFDLA